MDTNTADTNTADTEAADVAAIERVVAEVERTQRAEDTEGFLALFHPEAIWTTGHGKVRQVYRTAEGDSEGAPLYVMTRRDDGAWLLHACQNTGVGAD